MYLHVDIGFVCEGAPGNNVRLKIYDKYSYVFTGDTLINSV